VVTVALAIAADAGTIGVAVWGVLELVVVIGWALMFAVLLGLVVFNVVNHGRGRRRRAAARLAAGAQPSRAAAHPPELAALRRADPHFDEQLLLDAAQTATMLLFAASSIGDDAPIRRLTTDSFWQTPFGRLTATLARDRRREAVQAARNEAIGRTSSRRWNVPLDYHPSVPELTAAEAGAEQKITVRIAFSQLQAIVRPGAADLAAGAAATSLPSAMASFGRGVAAGTVSAQADTVSWLAGRGHFDMTFVRPAVARTDPSAALADRTCSTCGAAFRSELAIACTHCQAERPLPCGRWRLADATPV
jgi:hypothetical protein